MRYLIALLVFLSFAVAGRTQTVNAASCSPTDVQTALNLVNAATATVNIPACAATPWTTNLSFSIPSITTSLTIQGQTSCIGSGDPALNNLTCTDNTVIQDNSPGTFLLAISGGANNFLRLTGLTFQVGTGALKDPGGLNIAVGTLRVDHSHFNGNVSGTSGSNFLYWGGCTNGVADHNIFDNGTQTGFASRQENGATCGGKQNGDFPWSQASAFGTTGAAVFEANSFLNGQAAGASQANDCVFGGNVVFRFNSFQNGAHIQTHPTGHDGGDDRGCRMTEVYKNTWTFNLAGQISNTEFFYSAGVALWWGNSTTQGSTITGYGSAIQLTDCRSPSPTTRCGYAPSTTWGFCGSSSVWDANGLNGYPCIDQATRGQGDLLSGSFSTSNRINSALGSATWPRQKLEPLYYWLNAFTELTSGNSTGLISVNGSIWTQNVDYYVSSNAHSGTDCAGFTGATGIGCGARASRPATCTTGVAWWSTDQGSWNTSGNGAGNGVLDVCTATNTWTNAFYVPLAYPHPLEGTLAPAVSLSSSSVNFFNQFMGSTSSIGQVVVLTNTGTASLSIGSIAASGDFAQSNNCGTSLGIGLSCNITITFTPTLFGPRSGNVTITDNASGSPHVVAISGTGAKTISGVGSISGAGVIKVQP